MDKRKLILFLLLVSFHVSGQRLFYTGSGKRFTPPSDYFSSVNTSQSGNIISVTMTTNVSNQNQPPSFELVTVSGTETKTETLTATPSVFYSPGGYPSGTHTYQWYRADNQQSTGSAIGGATSSTYVLTASDVAKYLRCVVTPVQSGGINQTGTAVTSTYTGQIQDNEFNPLTDIVWDIAHTPEADDIDDLAGEGWVNRANAVSGLNNSVQNGSDPVPTGIAGVGVDFELSNNEELVLDQLSSEPTKPVEIWMRVRFESYNGAWARLIDWNGTHLVEQRDGGAIYLSGGSCAYSAPLGDWIIMRFVIKGSANTGEFQVNNGTNKTDVASATGAFGTSNGRLGANAAGTASRADVLWSHLFIHSGGELTTEQQAAIWTWFETYYPPD